MSKSGIIYAKLDPFFFQNRKIIRSGRNGREVFLFALCMNAQRGALGYIPVDDLEPWYVARQLGITEAEAADGLNDAESAGLLHADGDRVFLRGWADEWARRPKLPAEKQADYRERKKKGEEAQQERYRDEVTSYRQSNALPIRERERSERETRSNAPDSLSLLESYEPSERAVALAKSRRLDLAFELAQFRDKKREKGSKFQDVDAVDGGFCAWLRQSKDVDRTPDKPMAPKGARVGAHVTRQRNGDGEHWILTEADGNQRVVTDEEASKYPGFQKRGAA